MDKIEDWDFRGFKSILTRTPEDLIDPDVDLFLMEHFFEVILVDHARIHILDSLLKAGYAEVTPNKEVLLTDFGATVLPHVTGLRDLLTSSGRLHRRVVKSLVREWRANETLKFTILPPEMRREFPGLFEGAPAAAPTSS